MKEKEIFSAVSGTLIEKPKYTFTVQINEPAPPIIPKRTWLDKLLRRPLPIVEPVETERTFTIRPCKVGNMERVAGIAVLLPKEFVSDELSEAIMPVMLEHKNDVVYLIASAIQNNRHEPAQELIDFINDNFDNIDIFNGMFAAINGLEMQSFMNSIVLARGTVSVLNPETSPKDGRESIASHTAA